MVDILHRIGVKDSSEAAVYAALTTLEGLSGWWASDTRGSVEVGGVIQFRFEPGGFDMQVVDLKPAERVLWKVVDGPDEWVGTTVKRTGSLGASRRSWTTRNSGRSSALVQKARRSCSLISCSCSRWSP